MAKKDKDVRPIPKTPKPLIEMKYLINNTYIILTSCILKQLIQSMFHFNENLEFSKDFPKS